jgi:hypothetical protein
MRELLEEINADTLEARGGDPMNNRFHVSADTVEHKPAKVRKSVVCRDWQVYQLPPHITVGNRE